MRMAYTSLTGSNSIDKSNIMHTGTGRIDTLPMYPMSLYESKESNGQISLIDLFHHPNALQDGCESNLSIDELIFAACRGGWPSSVLKKNDKSKLLVARSYFEGLCREDMSNVDGVRRNETISRLLLRSYARNISTVASNSSIMKDMNANTEISATTFYDYVNILKKLICNPRCRSLVSCNTFEKRYTGNRQKRTCRSVFSGGCFRR